MAGAQLETLPSYFKSHFPADECFILFIKSEDYSKYLCAEEYIVAHHIRGYCKRKSCRYHIIVRDGAIMRKFENFSFNYERVTCPYSYYKFYICLAGEIATSKKGVLFNKLDVAVSYNRTHHHRELVNSLLWKRIGRRKTKLHLPSEKLQKVKKQVSLEKLLLDLINIQTQIITYYITKQ